MRVGCKARTQTNTRQPLQAGEMGTPSPRSKQLHTMGNHTRTASGRTTSTASGRPMGAPSPRLVCLTP